MSLMKLKCLDGIDIDPETCPLEELERIVTLCKREEEYWNTMQLSAKTFINSVYGVFGTSYFNLANVDIAESITLQGQDLIKYSVVEINDYFKNKWHLNFDGHKKVSDIMINKYGVTDFDRENFERLATKPLVFDTLQVYGDSILGDSLISVKDGAMKIEDMFNEICNTYLPNKIRVKSDREVWVFNPECGDSYVLRKVKYIMRHMTNKKIYRITSKTGEYVDVTEDHSLVVVRNGEYINGIKPLDIDISADKLILKKDACHQLVGIEDIFPIDTIKCFVYDISVDSDDPNEHNFIANGICVHNTDSVSGDTIVRTEKHPDGISIKDFYEENSCNVGDFTKAGHESVNTDDKVLNAYNGELYNANVKRIIRHKVTKPKWKLVASSGKEVCCTPDHSLVVVRGKDMLTIKPNEIRVDDSIIVLKNRDMNFVDTYELEKIVSCRDVGMFENEYVYDIEVDDDTHTFIANDILVHNSAYITMEPLLSAYGIPDDQMTKFCLAVHEAVMEKYLDEKFKDYANRFHCKENLEKFELEKISRSVIMLAKKNYMCDVAWIDSGVFFEQGHHITYTGYDVVKGATTNFCREEMKKFTNFCFEKIYEGRLPTQGECVQLLRDAKQRFAMQSPNEIGKTVSISEYEKFVKSDNKPQIEYFNYSSAIVSGCDPLNGEVSFISVPGNWKKGDIVSFYSNVGGRTTKVATFAISEIRGNNTVAFSFMQAANILNGAEAVNENRKTPVPIHVRAAAVYNNSILAKNRKYLSKYELLKSGDKIRFYYTSEDDVFGFIPDNFPYEFAPPVDVDVQFDKSLLSPINRIVVAMGLNEIPPSLTYSVGLF